ncbi:MAG: anthranilate phosphoribosyltransferase [Halothiobacillaceae bacterium]
MRILEAIAEVIEGRDLQPALMTAAMEDIMGGAATAAQIAGFMVALRMKGETVAEIAAAAQVMRRLAVGVSVDVPHLVDIVGTGGDGSRLFNVSTASSFVVAAAGGHVAKHGNRSITSRSGSADLLEAAGVRLDVGPDCVARCVRELGVGFMFAPRHHGSMRHAAGPRKELKVRTLFNVLGPLTNPADAPNMVLGVYDRRWLRTLAEVMGELGARHVLVVHAADGLDEISLAAETEVAELRDGHIETYRVHPENLGLSSQPLDSLRVAGPEDSLRLIRKAFEGHRGPAADMIALNAGAAIHVAGLTGTLAEGVDLARETLAGGTVAERLDALVRLTGECAAAQ